MAKIEYDKIVETELVLDTTDDGEEIYNLGIAKGKKETAEKIYLETFKVENFDIFFKIKTFREWLCKEFNLGEKDGKKNH